MADTPEKRPDAETSPAESPGPVRRKPRRLLKFLGWCGIMAVVIAAVVAVVAFVAYRNLATVVNRTLAEFTDPWRIEVGEIDIDFGQKGKIRIDDLSVRSTQDTEAEGPAPALFTAGSIEMDYDFEELRTDKKFQAIRVDKPVVHIGDTLLSESDDPDDPADETGARPRVLKFLGHFTDSLTVTGGKAEVALERLPPISLNWDLETSALDFASEEWLTPEPAGLTLSNLRVGGRGEHLSIDEVRLSLKIRGDLNGFEAGALHLVEPIIRITPEAFPAAPETPGGAKPEAAQPESAAATAEALAVLLEVLKIDRARFELAGFESLPDVSFETSLHWKGLEYAEGGIEIGNGEPIALALENLKIDGSEASSRPGPENALAEIRRLELEFLPADLIGKRRLESVVIEEPVIRWNARTAARFTEQLSAALATSLEKADSGSGSPAETPPGEENSPPVEIGSFAIRGGQFESRDIAAGDLPVPDIQFDIDLQLRGLEIGGPAGFRAMDSQELNIANLRIGKPGSDPGENTLIAADEISTRIDWESFRKRKVIGALKIEKPQFTLTDATLAPWLSRLTGQKTETETATAAIPEKSDRPPETEAPPVSDEAPPLWIIDDLAITGGVLRLDTGALDGRLPKVQGTFEIAGVSSKDPQTHPYRATFHRLRIRSRPELESETALSAPGKGAGAPAEEPGGNLGGLFPDDPGKKAVAESETSSGAASGHDVGFVHELGIHFTAEGIQREKKIGRIVVDGGILNVGDGLEQLVNGKVEAEEDSEPEEPAKDPAAAAEPAPQPLAAAPAEEADPPEEDGAAAAAPAAPPKSQLEGWRLGELTLTRSRVQFEALIPQIAGLEFDIETSLTDLPLSGGGLLSEDHNQKVELTGIQIRDPYGGFQPVAILPTIFVEFTLAGLVGQRIDKIDLIGPELFVGEPLFQWIDYQRRFRKQNEGAGVGLEGAARPIDPPSEEGVDWEIRQINAYAGKIIIAPVGYPLGVVPFPFEASTKMDKGKIDLKLKIPDENHVYRFPDFELDLHGLDGKVEFNVPIKQEENNFVQTFELKRAVWKQYEARDLWMFVSFDAEVIHGEFGGKAYDGYAKGEFNFYLKKLGEWDAWISGTKMDMGPITDVLIPENFRMDGVIDCKLVSEGKGLVFGETWGEILALNPGRVNVTKLDEFLEDLPESWSVMKRSATQLGLETLKQFDYEEGRADLYFVDRDGWFQLNLTGPTGSREFNLYAHDWRSSRNKKGEAAEKETKLDTASAGPSNETNKQGSIDE